MIEKEKIQRRAGRDLLEEITYNRAVHLGRETSNTGDKP